MPGVAVVEALARRAVLIVLLWVEEPLHFLHGVKVTVFVPQYKLFICIHSAVENGLIFYDGEMDVCNENLLHTLSVVGREYQESVAFRMVRVE